MLCIDPHVLDVEGTFSMFHVSHFNGTLFISLLITGARWFSTASPEMMDADLFARFVFSGFDFDLLFIYGSGLVCPRLAFQLSIMQILRNVSEGCRRGQLQSRQFLMSSNEVCTALSRQRWLSEKNGKGSPITSTRIFLHPIDFAS